MTLHAGAYLAFLGLATIAYALPAAAEEMKFMADLSGAAQVPSVETDATGMADVTVDTEAMTVSWMLTYEGLSGDPVAAHFHGPASPEETAPPVVDLTMDMEGEAASATETATTTEGTGTATDAAATDEPLPQDIMIGTAEITEEQLTALRDGMMYINIHTEMHPDGEIRGQVVEGEADIEAMEAMQGDATGEAVQDAASGEAPEVMAAELAADIEAGESIYKATCRNCHGPKAAGMASFPKLAGQEAAYLVERLQQYHAGETVGPNSALMIPVAEDLSAEDIANVAAYIATTFQ